MKFIINLKQKKIISIDKNRVIDFMQWKYEQLMNILKTIYYENNISINSGIFTFNFLLIKKRKKPCYYY